MYVRTHSWVTPQQLCSPGRGCPTRRDVPDCGTWHGNDWNNCSKPARLWRTAQRGPVPTAWHTGQAASSPFFSWLPKSSSPLVSLPPQVQLSKALSLLAGLSKDVEQTPSDSQSRSRGDLLSESADGGRTCLLRHLCHAASPPRGGPGEGQVSKRRGAALSPPCQHLHSAVFSQGHEFWRDDSNSWMWPGGHRLFAAVFLLT